VSPADGVKERTSEFEFEAGDVKAKEVCLDNKG
jgi:hypothetical protein